MKVEIWSDVMCPFCYIGKRRFEKALEDFEGRNDIEIEWKSFLLNPDLKTDTTLSPVEYLSQSKGMNISQIKQMMVQVEEMGKGEGLKMDLTKTVVANTFNAHRLIQMAKVHEKGDLAEELLFKAHFEKKMNTDDPDVLLELGDKLGLDRDEVELMLNSDQFSERVQQEYLEAQQLGVKGVPFFVFDRKYGLSGAQSSDVFLQALNQAYEEQVSNSNSCDTDGRC
ncbi:DsbA family oxidoreductase [Litoribacter populi]|uniref:DsbA family oxidoreductase n=1 Tax=Litoribacter populi TaxID=2598460 RepID=UPI001181553F|nr:DsbA family oxidoreductase [Litoribacter populi]